MPTAPLGTSPVVNLSNLYISGLQLAWLTNSTLNVTPGQCRDSTNVNDIQLPSVVPVTTRSEPFNVTNLVAQTYVINTAKAGALGLDILPTAGIAASTLYYVYAIGNSSNNSPQQPGFILANNGSALLSLSSTAPTLPAGYDMFRRIGCVRTDTTAAPSHLIGFTQRGNSVDRSMWYNSGIAANKVLSAGTQTAFTLVDCSAVLPAFAETVNLIAALTPAVAGHMVQVRPTPSPVGVASTAGQAQMSGDVAAVVHTDNVQIPVQNIAGVVSFDYLVSNGADAVDLFVSSYVDSL
jgi:hypothetical protein